jgi:hypothetical protein
MNKMRARAQAQFPIVLLTLISIIQALALEILWSKVIESEFLWPVDMSSLVAWGMISVSLMGILQLWVMYSTLVIGFTWRPQLRDSILPFVIGIQEFMLVNLIGAEFNVNWLYVLASIFLVANYVVHTSYKRAREEPENAPFFRGKAPATWKDFRGAFAIIGLFVLFGMLITVVDNTNLLALIAMVFANITLLLQIVNSKKLWDELMTLADEAV